MAPGPSARSASTCSPATPEAPACGFAAGGSFFRATVESAFSTVKLRTKSPGGAGSSAAAVAMVFRLVESAQARRRAITGAHLVPLVRVGARFDYDVLVERR
ncbi:hypothetical protein ACFYZJ_27610 [Streptomyces sp. NPDC001848]|uniref:hypothetical protein n=1 Tax=Streptomyces sp. NPDC001848 TaxID=3364618 RepID=UPI0036A74B7C